jgi:hypothetical protein
LLQAASLETSGYTLVSLVGKEIMHNRDASSSTYYSILQILLIRSIISKIKIIKHNVVLIGSPIQN